MTQEQFVGEILAKGQELYRDMPWRKSSPDGTFDAYHILVSELMLQQTQVSRVVPKFTSFIEAYPSIKHLSKASMQEVLALWSGLGYNRRAKYLHTAAQILAAKTSPWKYADLVACKGIGQHTAAAILTYAYNQNHTFIETNIRTVYIHYFFQSQSIVTDAEIMEKVSASVSRVTDYRRWYWSLMDVGAHLKSQQSGHLAKAKSYKKQSTFIGSRRQLRGRIVASLLTGPVGYQKLKNEFNDERFDDVLEALINEHIVAMQDGRVLIV